MAYSCYLEFYFDQKYLNSIRTRRLFWLFKVKFSEVSNMRSEGYHWPFKLHTAEMAGTLPFVIGKLVNFCVDVSKWTTNGQTVWTVSDASIIKQLKPVGNRQLVKSKCQKRYRYNSIFCNYWRCSKCKWLVCLYITVFQCFAFWILSFVLIYSEPWTYQLTNS